MKEKLSYILIFLIATFFHHSIRSQTFEWAASMGGEQAESGHEIISDDDGNVYTVGSFSGEGDFDPGNGSFMINSNGELDLFIQKMDALGNFQWVKTIGGPEWDTRPSVAVDASGNIYVTGYFGDTVDFDPGENVYNLVSQGYSDFFVLKLDPEGNFIWATSTGGSEYDESNSIAIDEEGNVFTTGFFNDTVDFDPGIGTWPLVSEGFKDIFIQKLDSDGNFIWAKQIGSYGNCVGYDICFDEQGYVYYTGRYSGDTDFDPGDSTYYLTGSGVFILKLDNNGNFVWARGFGEETVYIYPGSIELDDFGNIYTIGKFDDNVDFDPGPEIHELGSLGDYDIFIQKLDANGNFVNAISIGWYYDQEGVDIQVDESGFIYATGNFTDIVDFNPDIYETFFLTAQSQDIFLLILDNDFNFIWATGIGGYSYDQVYSIHLYGAGEFLLTGSYRSTVDFDPGPGVFNLTAVGNSDVFVQKLDMTTVGVEELNIDTPGKLFPNPTTGQINFESIPSNDIIQVKIRDLTGRLLKAYDFTLDKSSSIHLPFDNGIYFIEFYNHSGLLYTEKVIKQ